MQKFDPEPGHRCKKEHRFEHDEGYGGQGHRSGGEDAGDHRQDDEAQDVIQDGGPQHHLGLREAQLVHILEGSGRDAHAGGAQGAGDQQGQGGALAWGHKQPGHRVAGDKSQAYFGKAETGHRLSGPPELVQGGLQPRHKQEQDHPEAGKKVEDSGRQQILGKLRAGNNRLDLGFFLRR